MSAPDARPPLPPEPHESIANAIEDIQDGDTDNATAWALIAIATELGAIRRELRKGR